MSLSGRIIAAAANDQTIDVDFEQCDDDSLIEAYSEVLSELRKRRIIRSKNVTGDLGEHFAIECYRKNKNFPNLSLQDKGMQHIDAVSIKGAKRYSIKSTTKAVTGVVRTPATPDNPEEPDKLFDFMIIVQFDDNYRLKTVYEIDWETFLAERKWHSTEKAWNISVTKKLIGRAKTVYPQIKSGQMRL